MENFPGIVPEQPDDDDETKAEKKAKKDGKEIAKKASLLEWFQAEDKNTETNKDKEENDKEVKQEDNSPEELDKTEQKITAEQIIDDRLEQVSEELTAAEPESEAAAAAIAAATFLQKIGDKVTAGESLDDQTLDEATAEAADELNLPLEEISIEAPAEDTNELLVDVTEAEIPVPEIDPDEDNSVIPAVGSNSSPPSSQSSPVVPPLTAPSSPLDSAPQYRAAYVPSSSPDVLEVRHSSPEDSDDRHSHLPYVLAGGLVGYLVGRRRGRIKTEHRLLPIQQKLETQVRDMHDSLLKREETIRRLGARHRQELSDINRAQTQELVKRERAKRADTLKIYEKGIHKQPERIGKFALISNTNPELTKRSETISDSQVLEVAKQIKFEGTNLEELYKRGRLELKDVKDIVHEYLKGTSFERLIRHSLRPERLDNKTPNFGQDNVGEKSGPTRLAELLPDLHGLQPKEQPIFRRQKESHIATRVAIVSAAVALVIVIAVVIALLLLGGL